MEGQSDGIHPLVPHPLVDPHHGPGLEGTYKPVHCSHPIKDILWFQPGQIFSKSPNNPMTYVGGPPKKIDCD